MNDKLLQQFLNRHIRVKWNTQDELEALADLIDKETGRQYDRSCMRGYSPKQWKYWGISHHGVSYCLWNADAEQIYSAAEFIGLFNSQEEQDIDISNLL